MENNITEQIAERMAGLPGDVRQAILSADISKKVQEIGKKYLLHIDQAQLLDDATLLVILGFIEPADFVKQLQGQLRIPADQAEKISADINQQVLLSIRESMKRSAAGKQQEEKVVSSSPVPQQPSSVPTPAPVPQAKPLAMAEADLALTQKAITPPSPPPLPTKEGSLSAPKPPQKQEPQKPNTYKADPYREPPE